MSNLENSTTKLVDAFQRRRECERNMINGHRKGE